ncbi:hypothetical protein Vi05172_g5551 [Venturia inaequalis]|nr:hypothetical protein Vi05172_g5551 [Venturia inaequalis]
MATMPSSPPRRIHSRASSVSSNSSQYSLNLDALMPPDENDESSLMAQQSRTHAIDVVNSEDIDGPTDFTQNMEHWMSIELPTVVEPTKLEGAPKKDMEEYVGSDDTPSTTKHVPTKHDSPFEKPLDEPLDAAPPELEPPSPSTPRTVVELTSPPSRPMTRQATVEDYEDTPVRPRDPPSEGPPTIPEATPGPSETERSLEIALETLRVDLAWVRNQMEQQEHRHARLLTETKTAHETQLRKAQDAHSLQLGHKDAQIRHQDEQLEEAKREIVTLGRELEELGSEKARVTEELSCLQENHDTLQANAIKLKHALKDTEQDMIRLRSEHAEKCQRLEIEYHQEISTIEAEAEETALNALEARSRNQSILAEIEAAHRQELSAIGSKHCEVLSTMKAEAEQLLSLQDQTAVQIDALTEERAGLRLKLDEVEAAHRRQVAELENQAKLAAKISPEKHPHEKQLQLLQEQTSAQINALTKERDLLQFQLAETEDEHRQELSTIEAEAEDTVINAVEKHTRKEEQSSAQIALLTKERDLLLSKIKDQKSRNARSQSEFELATAAFGTKVDEMTTNNAVLTADLHRLRVKLSNTVRMAESKINAALEENRKLSTELQATDRELQAANEKLRLANEKSNAINAQFDKTVKDMLRKKDKEWRGRFADLQRERNIIGKVLMKEWGEKECGPMEPQQGYRYKYV